MIECRVEHEGFILNGRHRSRDSVVIVPNEIYAIHGPAGTATLAFIAVRKDRPSHPSDSVEATPQARDLANGLGILLSEVTGTGHGGQVRVGDVRTALLKSIEE